MVVKLDLIIYGATGFTGREAVKVLYDVVKKGEKIKWGIAGRSEEKLKQILKELGTDSIPYFTAAINNPLQLAEMCSQCKVVLNCVGPFQLYGEAVVKACLKTGTNYIDITAETRFIEKIDYLYETEAREKNVFVITACGVDSVLIEMGLEFLREKFGGTLNSVEIYNKYIVPKDLMAGASLVTYGTWESVVYQLYSSPESKKIQKQFDNATRLPELEPKYSGKKLPHGKDYFKGLKIIPLFLSTVETSDLKRIRSSDGKQTVVGPQLLYVCANLYELEDGGR